MYRLIQVRVANRPGALHRITQVTLRPKYNIETLSLIATEDPKISIITLGIQFTDDDPAQAARFLARQLAKQVDVVRAIDLTALSE